MSESLNTFETQFISLFEPMPLEFERVGLKFVGRKEGSHPLGIYASYVYQNSSSHVELEVTVGSNGVNNVILSKGNGKDYFFLDSYLKHHGRDNEATEFFYLSRDPQAVATYLRSLVAGEWSEIILGKRWENIPYDFEGMK